MFDDQGMILTEVREGMYGLPQARRIVYDKLSQLLATGSYQLTTHTLGLFRHPALPISFCLVVDNIGVNFTNQTQAQHLLDHRNKIYETTVD